MQSDAHMACFVTTQSLTHSPERKIRNQFCNVKTILWDPRSGMFPKWGFGVAMLPVGALCFYQAHFGGGGGGTVLPKWPLWAHLFYSVFHSVSEFRRACFHQARVARRQAHCFVQGPLRFRSERAFVKPLKTSENLWKSLKTSQNL